MTDERAAALKRLCDAESSLCEDIRAVGGKFVGELPERDISVPHGDLAALLAARAEAERLRERIASAVVCCDNGIKRATNFTDGIKAAGGSVGPNFIMIDAVRTDIQEARAALTGEQK